MRILSTFLLLGLICPVIMFAQTKKGKNIIDVSTSLNYYPKLPDYTFLHQISILEDKLILDFLTSTSGTFIIEDHEPQVIERTNANQFPTQLLSIGFGIQLRGERGRFHEISISRLSFIQSESLIEYYRFDTLADKIWINSTGFREQSFTLAFRYAAGKYFGPENGTVRFGLSGAIEPVFFSFRREPYHGREFPLSARIFQLNLAVIPALRIKLSEKVGFETKIIPNFLLGSSENVREHNPVLLEHQEKAVSDRSSYHNPSLAFSLAIKYQLYKPQKRRR